MYAPNSDGIDPDSSRDVMIEHNDVSCGDDHIAIKAGVCGEDQRFYAAGAAAAAEVCEIDQIASSRSPRCSQ